MNYKLKDCIAISGSGVLFNTETGESFSVNALGTMVIELIRKNMDHEQIKDYIFSEYIIDLETLDNHLEEFLAFMKHHHLIDEIPAT
jgi:hypothetical protein